MFPLSADLEILIPIPARAEASTAGAVAWLEKHFQMMNATVVRRGADSLEVDLPWDYAQYQRPTVLRPVRRIDIEVRSTPYGLVGLVRGPLPAAVRHAGPRRRRPGRGVLPAGRRHRPSVRGPVVCPGPAAAYPSARHPVPARPVPGHRDFLPEAALPEPRSQRPGSHACVGTFAGTG